MSERTKLPPNLHFFLHAPSDAVLIIESKAKPKNPFSGDRKVIQRCFIDFSSDDVQAIKVKVNGKERMKWKP